jgi:radical SAM superfamily enzyme YgiQ (UPF0313 family)
LNEKYLAELFALPTALPIYCIHPTPQWAPLALGLILGYAAQTLDPKRFDTTPRFAANQSELQTLLDQTGPGICLFSNYMWTRSANLELSRWLKQYSPLSLTLHGGPDTPAYLDSCKKFLEQHPEVDLAIHGEGEETVSELLNHWSQNPIYPDNIAGLAYLKAGKLIKTVPRARSENPNQYPSPYLNGIFESLDYQDWSSAPIESNRGCPYGCTFCDWGSATLQKIRLFEPERVAAEIDWLGRHGIAELWITDANFGIFERDVEITRIICQTKSKYGFPTRIITNYAKNTKKHLVTMIEMLVDAGLLSNGIVSLQTRDPDTLKAVNRTNIKTSEYDKLRKTFEDKHLPMSTQLMIGLPGSHRESFKQDLRFCFEQDIEVQIFRTVILPNSPMAAPEYLANWELRYDETGMLLSTRDISETEMQHIEQLARLFRCTHAYGMFKYWQSWLQWEYTIDPIDYLDKLLTALPNLQGYTWLPQIIDRESPPYDIINTHFSLREALRKNNAWANLYAELKRYTLAHYPEINDTEALNLVLDLQTALMPSQAKAVSQKLPLAHDFVAYYFEHRQDAQAPSLQTYPATVIEIQDPLGLNQAALRQGFRIKGRSASVWELESPLLLGSSREMTLSVKNHSGLY